jgi:hypothetical protein
MFFKLEVFFEDPFWVGLFSRAEGDGTQYCRVVFGGEPSDIQIYHYFLHNFRSLQFSDIVPAVAEKTEIRNPKRRQSAVSRQMQQTAGQKRSHAIIKQTMSASLKKTHETDHKKMEEEHQQYVQAVCQAKRKEKQRGH